MTEEKNGEHFRESSAFKSAKSDHKLIDGIVDVNIKMEFEMAEKSPMENGNKAKKKFYDLQDFQK